MILVTGATGNVGSQVVSQLRDLGVAVRAFVRNPDSASLPDNVDVVCGDLSSPETLAANLDGVDAVFLLWPFMSTDGAAELCQVLAARVRRIVYLSSEVARDEVAADADSVSADPSLFLDELERLVVGAGPEWTLLRPTGLAVNTLLWASQIREEGVVHWPFGEARRSLIHERDIAAVAVRTLIEDGHHGARYVISGPNALTQAEQVHIIGEALGGRPVRWVEIPRARGREMMLADGWPEDFVDGAMDAWAAMITHSERVTSTVEDLTGGPARSFREWVDDHVNDFR